MHPNISIGFIKLDGRNFSQQFRASLDQNWQASRSLCSQSVSRVCRACRRPRARSKRLRDFALSERGFGAIRARSLSSYRRISRLEIRYLRLKPREALNGDNLTILSVQLRRGYERREEATMRYVRTEKSMHIWRSDGRQCWEPSRVQVYMTNLCIQSRLSIQTISSAVL